MVRAGVNAAAGVLAAVLVAVGCGGPAVDPQQALAAFQGMVNRADLTYRFELTVLSDGTAGGGSAQAVGAVAGRDSAYRLTIRNEPNGDADVTDTVISGDRAFRRADAQPWGPTNRPDGFAGGDLATFLPLIGSAELGIVGRVDFDGASRIQLANAAPIPMRSGGDEQAMITRLEVLIGDDGTPIRVVAEVDPAGGTDRVVFEFRFTDVGTEISIEPPVIP